MISLSPATVVSVHDGDTLRVGVPLEGLWPELRQCVFDVRVAHVNAAELATTDGKAALASVKGWLTIRTPLPATLTAYGREKYGRLLGDLGFSNGETLSAYVLTLPGSKPLPLTAQLGEGA